MLTSDGSEYGLGQFPASFNTQISQFIQIWKITEKQPKKEKIAEKISTNSLLEWVMWGRTWEESGDGSVSDDGAAWETEAG